MFELVTHIDTDKIKEQAEKLNKFDDLAIIALEPSMQQSVKFTEAKVKPLIPVGVSGDHRRGVASEVRQFLGSVLLAGRVGSTIKGPSMTTLELGRKPGSAAPPVDALVRWVQLKMGVPADKARGVAYVVARNIGRRGFKTWPKGVRAYEQGFQASVTMVKKFHRQGVDRLLKSLKV